MPTWLTIELALAPFVIGAIGWCVRLEMQQRHNRSDIARIEDGQSKHNDTLYRELKDISRTVHRIEGFLKIPNGDR